MSGLGYSSNRKKKSGKIIGQIKHTAHSENTYKGIRKRKRKKRRAEFKRMSS
jgi:hypothetical protein